MCELLEFMYQGVVNVKHIELQTFMKVGQMLQIKGLASNPSASAAESTTSEKSNNNTTSSSERTNEKDDTIAIKSTRAESPVKEEIPLSKPPKCSNSNNSSSAVKIHTPDIRSPVTSPLPFVSSVTAAQQQPLSLNFKNSPDRSNSSSLHQSLTHAANVANSINSTGLKRQSDYGSSDALSVYSRKHMRRSAHSMDHSINDMNDSNNDSNMEQQMNPEDFFMPAISMVEQRYDIGNVKREIEHHGSHSSTSRDTLRNVFGSGIGFDYIYKNSASVGGSNSGNSNSGTGAHSDFANDMHMPSDYSKNFGNHMDIPPSKFS